MFDKFHDECGVFAIYGNPEAAKLSHLGLFALQHRGQESAGIAASDGREIRCIKSMGHVADIFTPPVLAELPGELAIGHTRYSTAGDTVLLNAQPFSVACNKGRIAVAHNGNITNAADLRKDLEMRGSIFQASSDTEVILHLVAHSSERTLAGALRGDELQPSVGRLRHAEDRDRTERIGGLRRPNRRREFLLRARNPAENGAVDPAVRQSHLFVQLGGQGDGPRA